TWIRFGWMKLRWPISPLDESLVRSLLRSLAPPRRPAIHSSLSLSRLSSNNRAMLTCAMRLPVDNQLVQFLGAGDREHPLPESLVAEHLRQLRQDLQVHVGRPVRHEQHEDERDGLRVGRVERNGVLHPHERAHGILHALDAAVRNRDALAEPGGSELLAREQAVEDQAARDLVVVLEEQADLLEDALLAADVEVEDDVRERQQLGDEAHARCSAAHAAGEEARALTATS